ncbi:glycoside hydrolase family 25 protein [Ruminococcus sp.]|uniref:glycoside hydrolase family 25 protein n=1 Tax=Ruminococcus sp. TaxID=41978 RepID=UPI0026339D4B|nr:glycoside hydrolase family 25 protein [Ruminococcus sp.]MDD6988334.1 glycoside hydrolase family 25 protein [Ruminococcus sp.]MDY6201970.1 glycoside hydrolase family 25 protein [Ruminococcus sp.]
MKRITCMLIASAMLVSAALCGCSDENSNSSSSQTATAATDTTVKTTGNKIHINDSTLGEIWITELDGVPVNKLDNNGFTADSNLKYYSENGKSASTEGIDVSSYSGDIDWKKVKESGIDFAMIRVGGRGYGENGEMYTDERALEYINGAKAEGIKVGAYFFSQAISTEEAIEEADYVKTVLGDIKLDYPVAYDWEIIKNDDARTDNVSANQATECARAFCDRVKELGYTPILYSPSRELYFKYDLSRLADIDIWYCEYANVPTFYYEFSMWQYSATGTIDGIEGAVDLNVCFTNVADYG